MTCAALTHPDVLPPLQNTGSEGNKDSRFTETYTSSGALHTARIVTEIALSMYPPGRPWFATTVPPQLRYQAEADEQAREDLKAIEMELFVRDLAAIATVENAHLSRGAATGRRGSSFATAKRMALFQLVITGDSLERIHDDFTIQVFNRRNYVTRRDSRGFIVDNITRERIDVRTLSDEEIQRGELGQIADYDDYEKRVRDIYTHANWNHRTSKWDIRQEVDGKTINESTEAVSPFINTAVDLAPEAHYGIGIVEKMVKANLLSLNTLAGRLLDMAYIASKSHPVIDRASTARADQLAKPSGTPLTGFRVQGGQVQDIAFLQSQRGADFAVGYQLMKDLDNEVAKALMSVRDSIRNSERTTGTEVNATAQEAELGLGGFYAAIADEQQVSTAARLFYMLEQKQLLKPLPEAVKKQVQITPSTGMAYLAERRRSQGVLSAVDVLSRLGPEMQQRLDPGVIARLVFEAQGAYQTDLVKSEEQLVAEQQAAAAARVQENAANVAVEAAASN